MIIIDEDGIMHDVVPTKVLEQIRAEIDGIEINGQIDEHTAFIRAGEQVQQMALNIIDKYKAESEEQTE